VDLDALCANAAMLLGAARPRAALLPMIKADAYGLGAIPVASALRAAIPAGRLGGFGVAAVAEGEELRAGGWSGRIIVFTPIATPEYARAARARLTLVLSASEAVSIWARTAQTVGRRLPFHIELDTGMGRSGFPVEDVLTWRPEVTRIAADRLRWEGLCTHFHSADEADLGPTQEQWGRFRECRDRLEQYVPSGLEVHVANSAAALRCSFPAELVRPGIFLYGGRVGAEPPKSVAAVRARVVLVRRVEAGTTVGYGATYQARPGGERWATLAIGYGDGVPRVLGQTGGEALVRGRRARFVGRVSMDTTVLDVTDIPGVEVDDVATVIGRDGEEEITVDDVARRAGTISYEILTGLTMRLPRVYRGTRDLLAGRLGEAVLE
jgi:alanine racemase